MHTLHFTRTPSLSKFAKKGFSRKEGGGASALWPLQRYAAAIVISFIGWKNRWPSGYSLQFVIAWQFNKTVIEGKEVAQLNVISQERRYCNVFNIANHFVGQGRIGEVYFVNIFSPCMNNNTTRPHNYKIGHLAKNIKQFLSTIYTWIRPDFIRNSNINNLINKIINKTRKTKIQA